MTEMETQIAKALMIVGGYAFVPNAENISIVAVYAPNHAVLMRPDGEILETNMDDVELDIVSDFWQRNRKLFEEVRHA